ncbi:hypothetical protein T492DRAFT_330261 [Pavlovales sp. CCMP2436]|nr:hypothetical protein T492DRAFT_330261 [Pavlovales sp. CCMP2436]
MVVVAPDPDSFHADAGALAATTATLDARIDELKSQVYDTVRVHKREFIAAYNRTTGLCAQARVLADDLRAVAREADGEREGFARAHAQSNQRMHVLRAELELSRELVVTLSAIAQAYDGLVQLTASLADGRHEEAADALISLEERVRALRARARAGPGGTVQGPRVLCALAAELQGKRAQLELLLDELLGAAISLGDDALVVSANVVAQTGDTSLRQVLGAMALTGSLGHALSDLGTRAAARASLVASGVCVVRSGAAGGGCCTVNFELRAAGAGDGARLSNLSGHTVIAEVAQRLEGVLLLLRTLAGPSGLGGVGMPQETGMLHSAGVGARVPRVCEQVAADPLALLAAQLWPSIVRTVADLATEAAVRATAVQPTAEPAAEADDALRARVQLPPPPPPAAELCKLLRAFEAEARSLCLVSAAPLIELDGVPHTPVPAAPSRHKLYSPAAPQPQCGSPSSTPLSAPRALFPSPAPSALSATPEPAAETPSLEAVCKRLPSAAAGRWRLDTLDNVRRLAALAGRGTVRAPLGLAQEVPATRGPPATPGPRAADGSPGASDVSADGALESWAAAARALAFAPCNVSACLPEVLASAHALMAAACAAGGDLGTATLLYDTVHDEFDLYRALAPHALGGGLCELPGVAMVVANDLAYLAHAAVTLGAQVIVIVTVDQ